MTKKNTPISKKNTSNKKWYTSIYLILTVIFIIWMLFFDTNSYLTHRELDKEISKLKHEKEYYKSKLDSENIQYKNLKNNKDAREKYARESYFLKKIMKIFLLLLLKRIP